MPTTFTFNETRSVKTESFVTDVFTHQQFELRIGQTFKFVKSIPVVPSMIATFGNEDLIVIKVDTDEGQIIGNNGEVTIPHKEAEALLYGWVIRK